MLRTLRVRDFAVIEAAELELDAPFVVLTGETGAGKSLLVDAVGLLTGMRAGAGLVRAGCQRLLVEAEFDCPRAEELEGKLDAAGIAVEEGSVILRREISATGRSRAWVNGSQVGVGLLADLASSLIRIRGQNESPELSDSSSATATLDVYGSQGDLRAGIAAGYREWSELAERCEALRSGEREREGKLDFARFQLDEIRAVSPRPEEEESLTRERSRLAHAARIREVCNEAFERISEGDSSAADQIGRARKSLGSLNGLVPEIDEIVRDVEEVNGRIQELSSRIGALAQAVEDDPARLEMVEERLEKIRRLLRKHGASVAGLLEKEEVLEREIAELAGSSEELARREPERDKALAFYAGLADRISQERRTAAPRLVRSVQKHLKDLAMGGTALEFRFSTQPKAGSPLERGGERVDFGPTGFDRVELLASANPGEPLRPLGRIASGGELSRIQLALAAALLGGKGHRSRALVFDEIDAGVGGSAAVSVGRKLRALSSDDQILCVTHLATIAARAHRHYRVVKETDGQRTRVSVETLSGNERIDELARMLAGEPHAKEARAHAKALLAETEP